jgi:F-type H+-transporting ATPase subunit epsilon
MKISFLTPKGSKTITDAKEIILPTTTGEIAVLKNHDNLVTELTSGTIEIKAGGKTEHFASFGGFAKITGDEVKVFSAGVEHADTLDEAKIQESIKRAEELKKENQGDVEFAAAAAQLERELARLKTLRRRKRG